MDLPEPGEEMTHDELSRLMDRWGNRPPEPMTEGEHAELRQNFEDKVSRVRETHPHFGENDARQATARLFPAISGELLAHPTRVSVAERINKSL